MYHMLTQNLELDPLLVQLSADLRTLEESIDAKLLGKLNVNPEMTLLITI